jgi:hypothetical protein
LGRDARLLCQSQSTMAKEHPPNGSQTSSSQLTFKLMIADPQRQLSITVPASATLSDLLVTVATATGILVQQLRLVHAGREIDTFAPSTPLAGHNGIGLGLAEGSAVYVSARLGSRPASVAPPPPRPAVPAPPQHAPRPLAAYRLWRPYAGEPTFDDATEMRRNFLDPSSWVPRPDEDTKVGWSCAGGGRNLPAYACTRASPAH